MTTEMKMETRNLASLRPAEYNPRVQLQPADPEYQNIKRSIETFGYVDPIIVNQDGTIIGGHQRYNVMKTSDTPKRRSLWSIWTRTMRRRSTLR